MMKKFQTMSTLLLSGTLLSAGWMMAQTETQAPGSQSKSSQYPTSQGTSNQGAGDSSQSTVQGCLSGSSGNFTLTDSSGNSYQLTGNTSKLSKYVGHQVQVTGTPASSSAQSNTGGGNEAGNGAAAGGQQSQQAFNVTSVKHIASSCSTGH